MRGTPPKPDVSELMPGIDRPNPVWNSSDTAACCCKPFFAAHSGRRPVAEWCFVQCWEKRHHRTADAVAGRLRAGKIWRMRDTDGDGLRYA